MHKLVSVAKYRKQKRGSGSFVGDELNDEKLLIERSGSSVNGTTEPMSGIMRKLCV